MKTWLVEEAEEEPLEKFLSMSALQNSFDYAYKIQSERFAMKWEMEDGSIQERIIEFSRLPFVTDDKYSVGIALKDVTESAEVLKNALKQAQSASQAKGSFLSNMSHEIRTPLNAVIGYLTIAKDDDSDREQMIECIEHSETAAKHLLQIINDVLDMSSIEQGKLKIAHEEFDLQKEIADISTTFEQNAKSRQIQFQTKVLDLTEKYVIGDQLRLKQVLMNLLSNAMKFTPQDGQVMLEVRQVRRDVQQVYLKFIVSDTGIGMPKEYKERMFQPFEQESATTAQLYGGSGLGLSIMNNLVTLMGGTVDVESEQNVGTTFTITMHFNRSTRAVEGMNAEPDYAHLRALIVDDQENDAIYVKTMLKRCGVKADIVTNTNEVIRRIKSRIGGDYAYEFCILDWKMPQEDGIQLAAEIRKEFGNDIQILLSTAYDSQGMEEEARAAGVNKILAKPLFQSTLYDYLMSTYGLHRMQNEANREQMEQDMAGLHILLAEDNEMNMDIAVTVLNKVDVIVEQAQNGRIAYEKFIQSNPGTYDMILMDIQMPEMNGYEATKKIRASEHDQAKSIPIIAMTANAFAEDVAEALANGMDAHIAKPVDYDKLFQVLQKFKNK